MSLLEDLDDIRRLIDQVAANPGVAVAAPQRVIPQLSGPSTLNPQPSTAQPPGKKKL